MYFLSYWGIFETHSHSYIKFNNVISYNQVAINKIDSLIIFLLSPILHSQLRHLSHSKFIQTDCCCFYKFHYKFLQLRLLNHICGISILNPINKASYPIKANNISLITLVSYLLHQFSKLVSLIISIHKCSDSNDTNQYEKRWLYPTR